MRTPLFRRLLGPGIEALPPSLRAAHDSRVDQRWSGLADVERSRLPLARLLCWIMRLPAPGTHVPVTVSFERLDDGEHWHRNFAGRRYASTLREKGGLLVEAMGPATNIFRVSASAGEIRLELVGFHFLGVPLPSALRPHCAAREYEEDGRYVFEVPVSVPWLGPVIRYTGRMERCDD